MKDNDWATILKGGYAKPRPNRPTKPVGGLLSKPKSTLVSEKEARKAIEDVVGGIMGMAVEAQRDKDLYKDMFEKDNDLASVLTKLEFEMGSVAVIGAQLIKDKFGIKLTNEQYSIILGLPLIWKEVESKIRDEQGSSCCVDKTRILIAEILRNNGDS